MQGKNYYWEFRRPWGRLYEKVSTLFSWVSSKMMMGPDSLDRGRSPPRQGTSCLFRNPGVCNISLLVSPLSLDELTVYKVQNLQWTADFSGDVTLSWMRPKKMPAASCVYNVYYRCVPPLLGESDVLMATGRSVDPGDVRGVALARGVSVCQPVLA